MDFVILSANCFAAKLISFFVTVESILCQVTTGMEWGGKQIFQERVGMEWNFWGLGGDGAQNWTGKGGNKNKSLGMGVISVSMQASTLKRFV